MAQANTTRQPQKTNSDIWVYLLAVFTAAIIASGFGKQLLGVSLVVLGELPLAVAIFLAGCGWGRLLFGKLTKCSQSKILKIAADTALGLWTMSTAMLILGSFFLWGLSPVLWRIVTAVGCGILIWDCRNVKFNLTAAKQQHTLLKYLIIFTTALVAGLWISGASLPAGKVGLVTKDFYDVESYHLQLPREYFDNGHISALPHNTYSNFPLGTEMLYLLAMCFKDSSLEALYAAKLTSGLWAIVAAMAIAGSFTKDEKSKTPIAAVFFLTAPAVIYLSWLAFVELAQCAYMAVGLGYLLERRDKHSTKPLIVTAISCGAACCVKYLSVGMVLAPVMAAVIFQRGPVKIKLRNALIILVVTLIVFSPWLIRNFIYTGNPVFPLATNLLGCGHWDEIQQQRWDTGHKPLGWADKFKYMANPAIELRGFGTILCLLAIVHIFYRKNSNSDVKNIILTTSVILLTQVLIWMLATHMPVRFLVVAIVPAAVLGANFISEFSRLPKLSIISLCCAAGIIQSGIAISQERKILQSEGLNPYALAGVSTKQLIGLSADSPYGKRISDPSVKMLTVGDIRPLYMPNGTLYASIWERDILVKTIAATDDPGKIAQTLYKNYGITDILINRGEIARIKNTYGWWDEINEDIFDFIRASGAKSIDVVPQAKINNKPAVEILIISQ